MPLRSIVFIIPRFKHSSEPGGLNTSDRPFNSWKLTHVNFYQLKSFSSTFRFGPMSTSFKCQVMLTEVTRDREHVCHAGHHCLSVTHQPIDAARLHNNAL